MKKNHRHYFHYLIIYTASTNESYEEIMEYPHLLSSFSIGEIKITNRIIMAPVYTAYGSNDSKVTDLMIDYYKKGLKAGQA